MGTEVEIQRSVLNPEVVWVDGRCYRKLPVRGGAQTGSKSTESRPGKPKPVEYIIEEEEDDHIDLPIQLEKNRFWLQYPIPSALVGFVVGKYQSKKIAIEEATGAELKIPPEKKQEGDIVILASTKKAVADAYNRINSIVHDARWKVGDYTNFISIPMNSREMQDGYLRFKDDVLQNAKAHGITESCFEVPAKLHLTIAMLTLLDMREKESAKELLLKNKNEILDILAGKAFRVEMKGIEYMNDDPSEVNVLYGKVREIDSDNCLQMISDKLVNAFVKVNLSRKEYDSVKLHVTLMKSRSGDKGQRTTFDARKILEKYAEYYFGQMTISEIHISIRKTGYREYYRPTFVLQLDS